MSNLTTNLDDLIEDIRFYSSQQDSDQIDDVQISRLVGVALRAHNRQYVCTKTNCTVPLAEHNVMVWLGCVVYFMKRLAEFSREASSSTSGSAMFATNRDTPYYKTKDLITYYETKYKQECDNLGLSEYAGKGKVSTSEVVIEEFSTGISMKIEDTPVPPPVAITSTSEVVNGSGQLIIAWDQAYYANFSAFKVFYLEGSEDIYQEWNNSVDAPAVPKINSNAEEVVAITDFQKRAVKMTGLTVTPGTKHNVIVVSVSKSGKYSYSAPFSYTMP